MYKIYKIKAGDDIDVIADRFSSTKKELLEINGFDDDYRAIENNLLIVPNNNIMLDKYIVKKGDSMYEIARLTNNDVDVLISLNGLEKDDFIYPGEEILIPRNNVVVYLTKDGDTLDSVASYFGVDKNKLVNDNDNILLEKDQVIMSKKEIL